MSRLSFLQFSYAAPGPEKSEGPSFLKDFLSGEEFRLRSSSAYFCPAVDVWENSKGFLARFDLPPVPPEKVKVSFRPGSLTVSGCGEDGGPEKGELEGNLFSVPFRRTLELPDWMKEGDLRMKFQGGTLEVWAKDRSDKTALRRVS